MRAADVESMNEMYGHITVVLVSFAIGAIVFFFVKWLGQQLRPQGCEIGSSARIVCNFRAAMLAQGLLQERQILALAGAFTDNDLHCSSDATHIVANCWFQEQFGDRLWEQKLIPGVPYKVWNRYASAATTFQAVKSGETNDAMCANVDARETMVELALALRRRVEDTSGSNSSRPGATSYDPTSSSDSTVLSHGFGFSNHSRRLSS